MSGSPAIYLGMSRTVLSALYFNQQSRCDFIFTNLLKEHTIEYKLHVKPYVCTYKANKRHVYM